MTRKAQRYYAFELYEDEDRGQLFCSAKDSMYAEEFMKVLEKFSTTKNNKFQYVIHPECDIDFVDMILN